MLPDRSAESDATALRAVELSGSESRSPAIHTVGLRKQFRSTVALRGLSMTVERGEVFGFLGPNGAGKTTAVKLLLGLVRPTGGEAMVLGAPAGDLETRRRIGYLPELFRYQGWLTAEEVLLYHCRFLEFERTRRCRHGSRCTGDRGAQQPWAGQGCDLLEGDATAPGPRRCAARQPRARRPRRANQRPRSRWPSRCARDHPRAAGARYLGLSQHPLARRGGAGLRPRGSSRPRRDSGDRVARRAPRRPRDRASSGRRTGRGSGGATFLGLARHIPRASGWS